MAASSDAPPAASALPANNDKVNPTDFSGSVRTDNKLPPHDTILKTADLPVLDREGKSHPFKSLYENHKGRTLVIFVRHFFCGVGSRLSMVLYPYCELWRCLLISSI
jgi:hypothetical protein